MRSECDPLIQAQLNALRDSAPIAYKAMQRASMPVVPGVYLITARIDNAEEPYYVGRTRNLRARLYQHLMSNLRGSSLKRYLVHGREFGNPRDAKQFILDCCEIRYLALGDATDMGSRKRGMLEGYAMGVLQPKYGFYKEH